MNSSEINFILKSLNQTKHIFTGVFACDTLPKMISKKPALLICNTDPISKPGEHWVAIYISSNNNAEYFDSFGLPPTNKYIKKFLERNCKKYIYNKQMIQSLFSSYCGHFCIMYGFYKGVSRSLNLFLKVFDSKNSKNNNKIVFDFFNKRICYQNSCKKYFLIK